MNISAFIAEDELFGREEIKHQLSVFPEVTLIGETDNGIDAVKGIKELRPDLIFLDIEMPGMKGLEVLGHISSIVSYKPFIVIVTAYDNYALNAFEYDVVDYLLKPIDSKRFSTAMNRVTRYFSTLKGAERITAKKGNKIFLIPVEDISYISVDNSVVFVHSGENSYFTTYRTLDDVEKELNSRDFFRTHRGYIVNLKKVREMKQGESGTMVIRVNDAKGTDIPVSRNNVKQLRSIFNL